MTRGAQVLQTMGEGEYFGEMAMLLKANRSATAIVSESGTQLVAISAANMDAMLRQNPAVILSLLQEMAQRLKSTNALLPP